MREHYLARRDLITRRRVERAVVVIGFPWKRGVVEIADAAGKPRATSPVGITHRSAKPRASLAVSGDAALACREVATSAADLSTKLVFGPQDERTDGRTG